MCKYIYHTYEQCNHIKLVRTESCWEDTWEGCCPCVTFPAFLFPSNSHHQSEVHMPQRGLCPKCEEREKQRTRRDYGGFTEQAARGVGSSQGTRQAPAPGQTGGYQQQPPRTPARTYQPEGYSTQPQMNMPTSQRHGSSQTRAYDNPRTGYNQYSRSTGQRSTQPPNHSNRNRAGRPLQRQGAVRGRPRGRGVVVDRLPRPPPRNWTAAPVPGRMASLRDPINRAQTVSPLNEDDMRAPFVPIPAHDEYAGYI
ncbi:hypothetical protein FSARC_9253 [Fusarium sarcochroum]|uniref:Uncharacterized protein n=1 Tax=Fusarium sarcochroum TaxID=1208366 RepID=A0A8H4TRH2_9HYPO|nr:hypothetical protein FSARC_9253 [Fusarium sarcochroum]